MRCRLPLILGSLAAVAAFALLAAGCGGGSPRVASIASTTTTATTAENSAVAFTSCMRANGVPRFPDPPPIGSQGGKPTLQQLGVSESQFEAAVSACSHLLPNGGHHQEPTITAADQADYLKGAACMRRHGVPDFPDPRFQNNNVTFNIPSSIDTNSSPFRSAEATCQKLIPAGLPYSSSSAR